MDLRREESHFETSALVVSLTVLTADPEGPWGEDVPAPGFPGPTAQNPLSHIRADIKTVLRWGTDSTQPGYTSVTKRPGTPRKPFPWVCRRKRQRAIFGSSESLGLWLTQTPALTFSVLWEFYFPACHYYHERNLPGNPPYCSTWSRIEHKTIFTFAEHIKGSYVAHLF